MKQKERVLVLFPLSNHFSCRFGPPYRKISNLFSKKEVTRMLHCDVYS